MGNTIHRIWRHPATEADRATGTPKPLVDLAQTDEAIGAAEFEKGISPSLVALIPLAKAEAISQWHVRPSGGTYVGTIYMDGSRLDGIGPRLGQNGWAFVVKKDTGRTLASASGGGNPVV